MIKVNYSKINDHYVDIKVSGHANYSEHGTDIVCSAVSILCYAIANKILNINESFNVDIKDNEFLFNNNGSDDKINLLLETLIEGLLMIEDQYNQYIKIKED